MGTFTFQLPDSLENEKEEIIRFLAAKLYEAEKLSLGQAAEMCCMRKWDFAEILINYGIHCYEASAVEDLVQFKRDQNIT